MGDVGDKTRFGPACFGALNDIKRTSKACNDVVDISTGNSDKSYPAFLFASFKFLEHILPDI